MSGGVYKARKSQSERAHKPAPDTSAKLLTSLDETNFQKLLERSADFTRQQVDNTTRERVGSDEALVDTLFQRELREVIDKQQAENAARGKVSVFARSPSPDLRAPVGNNLELDYIDDGMEHSVLDVEMQDLSQHRSNAFVQGNTEHHVPELSESDQMNNNSDDVNRVLEKFRERPGNEAISVWSPQNCYMPYALSENIVGSDDMPRISPVGGHYEYTQNSENAGFNKRVEFNNSNYNFNGINMRQPSFNSNAYSPPALGERPLTQGHEFGQRSLMAARRKKKKDDKKVIMSDEIEGFMGEKPVDELLLLIEGPTAAKKSKNSEKAGNVPKKEDKKRKFKDSKVSAKNASQDKDSWNTKELEKRGSKETEVRKDNNKENESDAAKRAEGKARKDKEDCKGGHTAAVSAKIGNQGGKVGGASSRASLEEEEFVSADEGRGGESPTAPSRYASVAEAPFVTSEVLLDGGNFFADDDDVLGQIQKNEQRDEDFIPVFKGKKIAKETPSSIRRNGSISTTSSSERRSSVGCCPNNIPPQKARHSSASTVPHSHTPCIADFIDDVTVHKTSHAHSKQWMTGAGKARKNNGNNHKEDMNEAEDGIPLSTAMEQMAILTPPQFSYADAAKRTSGENSPTGQSSPNPNPKSGSPAINNGQPSPTPSSISPTPSESLKYGLSGNKKKKNGYCNGSEKAGSKKDAKKKESKTLEKCDGTVVEKGEIDDGHDALKENPTPVPKGASTSSSLGISFFYDESEASTLTLKEETDENGMDANGDTGSVDDAGDSMQCGGGSLVIQLGDRKITFQDTTPQQARRADPRDMQLLEVLAGHWKRFQSGRAPRFYTPDSGIDSH